MAFKAPTLFTDIDPVNYRSEINENFRVSNDAFTSIQNELTKLSGGAGSSGVSNLNWVDLMLQADGPIGFDSWVPSFSQDTDGNFTLKLLHQAPGGFSSALINGVLHQTNTVQSFNIENLISLAGDGPFRFVIGLNSAGSPAVEQVVVANEIPTDDPELALFTFDYIRTTDGQLVINLKREARWHGNDAAWAAIRDRETILQASIERVDGDRWTADDTDGVFIIPFDCEVTGATAYISHVPQGLEFLRMDLLRFGFLVGTPGQNRSEPVHQGVFEWGNVTDAELARTVIERAALSPPATLLKGDYVDIHLGQVVNITTDAPLNPVSDELITLTAQLRIRPLQNAPRKQFP